MRKFLSIAAFLSIFFLPGALFSQFYFGAGVNGLLPQNKFKDMNKEAVGANVVIESRSYCNLWYGVRLDYYSFEKKTDTTWRYFENGLYFSPQVRYNFLISDCYNDKTIPYLIGMFTISSLGANDDESRFGLGGAFGLGVVMGFDMLGRCWHLDLSGLWSAPNSIARGDGRYSIQSINLGLTLSMSL